MQLAAVVRNRPRTGELRRFGGFVVAIVVTMLVAACSETNPHVPTSEDATMNLEQSQQDVLDIVAAVQRVVGNDGWGDEDAGWNLCSGGGTAAAQYTYATTRKLPSPGTPDGVAGKVAQALHALGYEGARVKHDTTLTPNRTVTGYNGGTAPDKFAIQFQANDGHADLSVYGHCVPGNVPTLSTSLNPRPTDSP